MFSWLLLAVALLFAARLAQASSYAERVQEKTFPNGLKVIVLEDHKAPVSVMQVWYRVGARNEIPGQTGLSHLLEHMMFKGTEKVGPEEYSRIVQKNGGNDNAFTSQDVTVYFASIASDRLSVVVDLEADRMQNLRLAREVFDPERAVVAEERRLRTEDNPTSALFEAIGAAAFTAHPYGWPVIGWMSDIQGATVEDALAYYEEHYKPSNAFIVVVGDANADDVFTRVEKTFGAIPSSPAPPPMRSVEPEQKGERRVVLRKEAELPVVGIAYHTPNASHPDSAALQVLASLLADGQSSRLYRDLVYTKQIARSVGASYDRESKDPALFVVYGQPLPGKTVADLEKALLAEVEAMKAKPASAKEMEKVKNSLEAEFVFAQDSLYYQAMLLGQYETLGDWRQIDQFLPSIRAVTPEEVQRVARVYLTAENRTVGTLDPLPVSGKPRPAAPAAPPGGGLVH